MRRPLRFALGGVFGIGVLAYAGAIWFLVQNENGMVYGGAGLGEGWPFLPADSVTIPWDTVSVEAEDGVRVYFLRSRLDTSPPAPWVIYFHGNGQLLGDENSVARYGILRDVGFNVLAVEYRGYGIASSSGPPTEQGVYWDGFAGWQYLTDTMDVAPDRIVLFGMSLGSGVATYLASRVRPAGLVTEGAFTTLPAVGQTIYPWLPISLIMRNRFDNLERARTLVTPWLLFHSRDDEVIPFSHARALAAVARQVKTVELRGSHASGLLTDEPLARSALRAFSTQVFGSAQVDGVGARE